MRRQALVVLGLYALALLQCMTIHCDHLDVVTSAVVHPLQNTHKFSQDRQCLIQQHSGPLA
jgi:hypothetical protein